jgi:hypothetical protein
MFNLRLQNKRREQRNTSRRMNYYSAADLPHKRLERKKKSFSGQRGERKNSKSRLKEARAQLQTSYLNLSLFLRIFMLVFCRTRCDSSLASLLFFAANKSLSDTLSERHTLGCRIAFRRMRRSDNEAERIRFTQTRSIERTAKKKLREEVH